MKQLKIKTLSGYTDKDNVMLHACFQLLVDYVEKELGGGKGYLHKTFGSFINIDKLRKSLKQKNYPKDVATWEIKVAEKHNSVLKEVYFLYKWWTKKRPIRENTKLPKWDKKINDFPDEYEDQVMLERLIKIRRYLWT